MRATGGSYDVLIFSFSCAGLCPLLLQESTFSQSVTVPAEIISIIKAEVEKNPSSSSPSGYAVTCGAIIAEQNKGREGIAANDWSAVGALNSTYPLSTDTIV